MSADDIELPAFVVPARALDHVCGWPTCDRCPPAPESAQTYAASAPPATHPRMPAVDAQRPNLGQHDAVANLAQAVAQLVDAFVAAYARLVEVLRDLVERTFAAIRDVHLCEPTRRPAPRNGPPPPRLDGRRARR